MKQILLLINCLLCTITVCSQSVDIKLPSGSTLHLYPSEKATGITVMMCPGRAYLFAVDFGNGDKFLADLASIDALAASKNGPGQVCIDRRDILRDERQRQCVLSNLIEK